MGALAKNFRLSLLFLIVLAPSPAAAEEWSRAYINSLPDSAFAAIEKASKAQSAGQ